ncbi:MAG: hypothetical protein DMG19_10490, partial [Acidobacteria bacterium]
MARSAAVILLGCALSRLGFADRRYTAPLLSEEKSDMTLAVLVIPSFVNSVSIARFTLCLQKSFATRTAFLIALALERP